MQGIVNNKHDKEDIDIYVYSSHSTWERNIDNYKRKKEKGGCRGAGEGWGAGGGEGEGWGAGVPILPGIQKPTSDRSVGYLI